VLAGSAAAQNKQNADVMQLYVDERPRDVMPISTSHLRNTATAARIHSQCSPSDVPNEKIRTVTLTCKHNWQKLFLRR